MPWCYLKSTYIHIDKIDFCCSTSNNKILPLNTTVAKMSCLLQMMDFPVNQNHIRGFSGLNVALYNATWHLGVICVNFGKVIHGKRRPVQTKSTLLARDLRIANRTADFDGVPNIHGDATPLPTTKWRLTCWYALFHCMKICQFHFIWCRIWPVSMVVILDVKTHQIVFRV